MKKTSRNSGRVHRSCAGPAGSALLRAAKRRKRLAELANEADRAYGDALTARYGWTGREELPDDMVEVIDYGNAPNYRVTLTWLDECMATVGLKPNAEVSSGPKT